MNSRITEYSDIDDHFFDRGHFHLLRKIGARFLFSHDATVFNLEIEVVG